MNSSHIAHNFKQIALISLSAASAGSLLLLLFMPATAARLGAEDGPVENLTALILLIASIAMAMYSKSLLKRRSEQDRSIALVALLIAAAFFVFAGEEISWGQRILGIESGEFMQQYNWQGEVNLHNLHTDISNIAFHYGAFIFLILLPLFHNRVVRMFKSTRLEVLRHFIAPRWLVAPSFIFLGMLDSRFVFSIEKPWAASLYLLALLVGVILLLWQLRSSIRPRNSAQRGLLGFSLLLIGLGLFVSYTYAVDEQATNIISEYKELVIAAGLCAFALHQNLKP